jgi:hypothetical protein
MIVAVEDKFVPGQTPPNRDVKFVSPALFAALHSLIGRPGFQLGGPVQAPAGGDRWGGHGARKLGVTESSFRQEASARWGTPGSKWLGLWRTRMITGPTSRLLPWSISGRE